MRWPNATLSWATEWPGEWQTNLVEAFQSEFRTALRNWPLRLRPATRRLAREGVRKKVERSELEPGMVYDRFGSEPDHASTIRNGFAGRGQ